MKTLVIVLSVLFLWNCAEDEGSRSKMVSESHSYYQPQVPTVSEPLPPMEAAELDDQLDVRGVGDSAWIHRNANPSSVPLVPLDAGIGSALESMDPDKALLKGDLSLINWEAVILERCRSRRTSVSFAFYTDPENIYQAYDHGFNLFSMANNHSRDCNQSALGLSGPGTSAHYLEQAGNRLENLLWAGVGPNYHRAQVRPMMIKGEVRRVALASIGIFSWNIPEAATIIPGSKNAMSKAHEILSSFRSTNSDIKVLSIHTQDSSGSRGEGPAFRLLKEVAEVFIRDYNGHVVFGHGPHTFAGVKLVKKANESYGVVFTSLGNFIHEGLRSNPHNYIGRVLLDPHQDFGVKHVSVIPFSNQRTGASFYRGKSAPRPKANFNWQVDQLPSNGYSLFHASVD